MRRKSNSLRLLATEEEEQIALFSWAKLVLGRFPGLKWMFHIPNGGKRSAAEAARFRAAGVKSGVSDIFVPKAEGGYHGLFIELKAMDGRPSDKQREFIRDMRAEGYCAVFAYGAEEAMEIIKAYMDGREVYGREKAGL